MFLLVTVAAPGIAGGAGSSVAPGVFRVNLGVGQRVSDILIPGMNQPSPHGGLGGTVEFQIGVARGWLLSVSGSGLGSWFDYNNGLDADGNSTEFEPGFRLGIDRLVLETSGNVQALVGAGFESQSSILDSLRHHGATEFHQRHFASWLRVWPIVRASATLRSGFGLILSSRGRGPFDPL
jgi:hypothetical protein